MADVFAAHDERLGRDVALKVFRGADAADRRRFDAEDRLLAQLDHPHLTHAEVREVINDVERAHNKIHGYGAAAFGGNLRHAFKRLAPEKDLAAAVSEQRRRSRNAGPVLVPVDVRDWEALFPPDTPGAVRSIIQWLREGKR